jgi:hypothetical protein
VQKSFDTSLGSVRSARLRVLQSGWKDVLLSLPEVFFLPSFIMRLADPPFDSSLVLEMADGSHATTVHQFSVARRPAKRWLKELGAHAVVETATFARPDLHV